MPPYLKRRLNLLAVAIVLAGLASAWWYHAAHQPPARHPETLTFTRPDDDRLLLIDAFRSQDSEAAVAAALEAAGLTVQRSVIERPPDLRYPPRRVATFTVQGYRHLGCPGTLLLEFFNNRLMEVDFSPDDPARYAPRMRQAYPGLKSIGTGHAEWIAPPLRVWSSVELARSKVGRALGREGRVLWQDTRMIRQRDDWDARFGSIPVPARR